MGRMVSLLAWLDAALEKALDFSQILSWTAWKEQMPVYVELTRWADGSGIRLPKAIMDQAGLAADDRVEIIRWGDSIVIHKIEDQGKGSHGQGPGIRARAEDQDHQR